MILWKLIAGLVLFITSSFIAEILTGFDISFVMSGIDYAPIVCEKVLDCIAGSLIVWGFLSNPKVKRAKY